MSGKLAALGPERPGGEALRSMAEARLAYAGLEIDFEELETARHMVAISASQALVDAALNGEVDDFPMIPFIVGIWMDGLITGILMEEKRS